MMMKNMSFDARPAYAGLFFEKIILNIGLRFMFLSIFIVLDVSRYSKILEKGRNDYGYT